MIHLYNTLTEKKEEFKPIEEKTVRMYTCGPTVYDYLTIGNWRTYTLGDLLHRLFKYNGYDVTYVMNITDVGHLTGDNEGDASSGEDRLEKAAEREHTSAWDIAEKYTQDFYKSFDLLHLLKPEVFAKATDHIEEQIDLIQKIEEHGFTYQTSDGVYFDVGAYEAAGNIYGELSTLDELQEGARVAINPERKDPRDFALWKFSPTDTKRDMEWKSPWGVGFPGWHIECSAMSMKYLGEQFDVHVGGEDLRSTHHPNEIAQSEAATEQRPFVRYWVHGAFLLVDGGRMGKSLGNAYTLHDVEKHGFSPPALRYFYLSGHYRKQLNFTWDALQAASNALDRLYDHIQTLPDPTAIDGGYREKFISALNDDLNTPQALAVLWDLIRDEDIEPGTKKATLLDFDQVLGLKLDEQKKIVVPDNVQELVDAREMAREEKDFKRADSIRKEIEEHGYTVLDTESGPKIKQLREK